MNLQIIRLKNNQNISCCEYGERTGIPIFYFHGFPGSHLEVLFFNGDDVARKLNLRIIAVDRPGYGDSYFIPGRSLLDWPDLIVELADFLGIDTFSILGYSGGAPYALVCAHKIPDRLNKVGIVSGMVPFDFPKSKKGKAMFIPKLPRWLQSMMLKNMNNMVRKTPEKIKNSIIKSLPDVDREILKRPETMHVFLEAIQEAFKNNHKGALQDANIYKNDWGFVLPDVRLQIVVWHGEKDLNVDIESVKYLTNLIPNCIPKFYPTDGHISLIYNHIKEILALLGTNNRL